MSVGTTGMFRNVPMEQYAAIDAINFSWLKHGLSGVGYMLANRSASFDSASLLIGRAVHCRLLEPDKYESRYTTAPKIDRRTNAGKEEWAAYVEAAKGREVLTDAQAQEASAIAEAVERNSRAVAMLRAKGERELVCVWRDEPTGLLCKCRMDLLIPGAMGLLTDLKTAESADPESFARAMLKYSYDVQSAMYHDAYKALTGRELDHTIIAADTCGCFVYRVGDATVNVGRIKYRSVLHQYARVKSGEPAWDECVRSLDLPDWELRKYSSEGGIL